MAFWSSSFGIFNRFMAVIPMSYEHKASLDYSNAKKKQLNLHILLPNIMQSGRGSLGKPARWIKDKRKRLVHSETLGEVISPGQSPPTHPLSQKPTQTTPTRNRPKTVTKIILAPPWGGGSVRPNPPTLETPSPSGAQVLNELVDLGISSRMELPWGVPTI